MRSNPVRLVRSLLPAVAVLVAAAPAADAAERYASPTGSAVAPCSVIQPCTLDTAVSGASARDEVIVTEGTYTVASPIDAPQSIDLHGVEGGPKPVLVGAESLLGSVVSFTEGGSLRHLDIRAYAADQDALTLGEAATAESLLLFSEYGDGAKVSGYTGATVLRDSVVYTRAIKSDAAGLKLRNGPSSQSGDVALRNVTVYAPATKAILCETTTGGSSIVNVIARGMTVDIDGAKAGARCATSYSGYRGGAAAPAITPGPGDVLGDPAFVEAPAGRLDLFAGPLVDTGAAPDARSGTKDALGRTRPVGGPYDIGAYEWTPDGAPAWLPPKPVKPVVPEATPTPTPEPGDQGKADPPGNAHGLNGTQPGKTKEDGTPARPVIGKSVVLAPASGKVRFKAPGGSGYVELDGSSPVPSGSLIDTRHGTVSLSSALDASGRSQTGRFNGALFQVTQSAKEKGMTVLKLRGEDFSACKPAKARGATTSAKKKQPRRRLWGSDKGGKFRTQGRDSVATARGTRWMTEDTCAGTRVKVTEGAVEVKPLRGGGKAVLVKAGQQRLVRSTRR